MSEANPSLPSEMVSEKTNKAKKGTSTFSRVVRYTAVRLITMVVTVVIGVYLTILIANMGGYVDQIRRAQIREDVMMRIANMPSMRNIDPAIKQARIEEEIRLTEERFGMNRPFIARSFDYLINGLTLNLGRALQMTSNSGSNSVRLIILERLPPTLVLFGASDIILFFMALFFALILSRQYGSVFDKILVGLTPLSSAPGWFYGIFLILIFASVLRILPFGGMVDAPPPASPILYFLSLLKHMLLPVLALTISNIFLNVFSWRTFFLIYSSEDYVDMAKAKGLTSRDIERRYILRPTLPTIITSFALLVIASWLGAPILETIFSWPGLGRALFQAVGLFDTPVIVAEVVVFSYLLAITVFVLEFVYALVDPRVKIGGGESKT
jgi:peptide/nickel transport system permease protein